MTAYMAAAKSVEWATPPQLFDHFDVLYNFTLDAAASDENAKCAKYFTIEDDGLSQSWEGERVWLNPPYGVQLRDWIAKAYRESLRGAVTVMLIPVRSDTAAWHDYIFPHAAEVQFLRGRVKFGNAAAGAPFPLAVVRFGGEPAGIHAVDLRDV